MIRGERRRWSYLLLSYGLLLAVAWRSFVRGEAAWDLLGLVVLSGVVNAAYRGAGGIVDRRRVRVALMTIVIAAVLALVIVLVRTGIR